ncbi:chitin binding peritrophin-A domain-containing protein [Flavobacterium sp. ASV13]|uniref:chitin binding peritrophin-A domain-containing protein n=1 Tax=Flavobacterium sp. ASV13 TaxID=1506583 RepID=UPI0005594F03|nr:chitin binding peritrophin-A domain-containing protein [Flavobacterium sp. ASV13]
MKNKIKLIFNHFLLVLVGILLFNLSSCATEEYSSENAQIDPDLIVATKQFVESEMSKNKDNAFLTSFPLTPDWEHVFAGKDKSIRVPMISNKGSQDTFELFIIQKEGKFVGEIVQFMPFDVMGITSYHRILYSLQGKRETDLLMPKSYVSDLQKLAGKKLTGKTKGEDFSYLCGFFRDNQGNPAQIVVLNICPDGTLFNNSIQVCDWPDLAGENARKSFFSVRFSDGETINVSTYGFLEELEEVTVDNNYQNPNYVGDDSSVWINFPPNYSYPSSPGGGGDEYYPIGELPTVTTKAQEVRSELSLNNDQFNWLKQRPEIANSLFDYLFMESFSSWADVFALDMINQMMSKPGLVLNPIDSYKSPFNVDRSAISTTTPEGIKFNEIYGALKNSPQFKTLFLDIFDGDQARFNVKFEINDHVYEDNNPAEKEVNATTSQDPITNIITIRINRQILIAGTDQSQTKIENAKTILHECIHAYLFIKSNNSNIGMDIGRTINSMYPVASEQHDFMYGRMIPIMQNVLSEIRDFVTTPENRNKVEQRTMHPTINPLTSTPWDWNEYYKYLSLKGLDEAYCFLFDYPKNSDQWNLLGNYVNYGHEDLRQ